MEVTIIISTYNRREKVKGAIESVLSQQGEAVSYEVIVVDNNSRDGTREVVREYEREAGVRYVFEERQGVSYARNAGIREARGEIIAFTDDDVRVTRGWVAAVKRAFDLHPDVDFIGGKVLPLWEAPPPPWMTRDHWMPLALLDYGDTPFYVDAGNPLCLITANLGVRRKAFEKVGLFAPELQRVGDGIGSMEDHELLLRFYSARCLGLYVPEITVTAEVPAGRLEKAYHRRWHTGHGHFYAVMRSQEFEPSSAARLLDVPGYLYKQAIKDAAGWLKYFMLGKEARSLACEMRLRFFMGFFRKRRDDFFAGMRSEPMRRHKDAATRR
jgi:glycosyltransferase involved in cell wall biosynthesis